jgi:ribonuclease P protein component
VIFYKEAPQKRVAFVASKKVGKAVARNRAKRILRALALEFIDRLSCGEYIFVAKPALLESDFMKLRSKMRTLLKKGALI